jgi:NAD(P)-dependent dehydrogenase (short-subunit alcohol dehydrogenase family)
VNTSDLYTESELVFIQADLSMAAGCTKVVNEVTSGFGGIDILVSVVGASSAPSGGFATLSDEEWQKELNINLLAAVRLDRGLLPGMIKQGSGVIIHVSSIQRRLPLFEATIGLCGCKSSANNIQQGSIK